MIFKHNLNALKNNFEKIYNVVKEADKNSQLENVHVEKARKGGDIIVYTEQGKDIFLNSRYDPLNEADKYMEEYFAMPEASVLIMFGLSNGYYAREYIKNVKADTRCIIFEPSLEIFMQVVKTIDISDLLESDRVYIIVAGANDEEFSLVAQEWFQIYNINTNELVPAPKYQELFYGEFEYFKRELEEIYQRIYISSNTAVEIGKEAVRNNFYNMLFFEGCRNGMELCGKFPKDMPAIVVSSGPSLEKNIEMLKRAKGKAFIFVVDSAIPKVLEVGVKPDAVISVDRHKSPDNFKAEGLDEIPFFAHMDLNTEVLFSLKPKNLFFYCSDNGLCIDLFKKSGSNIDYMEGGGSVATAAITNLISWGFQRIILIGQDLAFTGNRMHAGEDVIEISGDDGDYKYVKDIDGNDVIIRQDYYMYLRWIEETALNNSDIEFIDATEGGAVKKNLKQMTLEDAIEAYCIHEYNIADIFLAVPRLFEGANRHLVSDVFMKIKKDFKYIKKQLAVCKADCRLGVRILESGETNIKELKRINNSIRKTDELISDCDERMYLYKYNASSEIDMMQDIYAGEEDDIKETIHMYEQSEKYYNSIEQVIPELIDIIDDCILRMEGE
ncbi:MAG: DUF115 domain-containing protein [Clostridium sp.]|nr:DUF115 domain-containing protein [Clostridium sp.]MCM1458766.1 DUF115 domain-containing protein [Bacteroides sp.]